MTGVGARQQVDLAAMAAEIARATGVRVRRDEALARHTTIHVGGPADLLAVARDAAQLAALVRFARSRQFGCLVIGRGSNVVASDAGIRGLIVLSRAEKCRVDGDRVIAEAGLLLARAATVAGRAGLSGLEFGLAIPGTVGGAVWANAGAHGSDVAAVLESVRILHADGAESDEPASALGLAYRESRFRRQTEEGSASASPPAASASAAPASAAPASAAPSAAPPAAAPSAAASEAPPADIVLEATFRLTPADPASIRGRLEELRAWRRAHQPLNLPSAGSIFRNPPGDSAGRLIDAAGLKGTRRGGAVVSELHANFIVNDRGATAADVRRLAELARTEVARMFGVDLVYEVQFLGDWSDWRQEER